MADAAKAKDVVRGVSRSLGVVRRDVWRLACSYGSRHTYSSTLSNFRLHPTAMSSFAAGTLLELGSQRNFRCVICSYRFNLLAAKAFGCLMGFCQVTKPLRGPKNKGCRVEPANEHAIHPSTISINWLRLKTFLPLLSYLCPAGPILP